MPERLNRLQAAAERARDFNYSPYSRLVITSAVETMDGKVYGGSNVENVNFSLTKHAEEVALLAAITDGAVDRCGLAWIRTVLTVGAPPCGSCRQFISEWASAETEVAIEIGGGVSWFAFSELLPHPFGRDSLPSS